MGKAIGIEPTSTTTFPSRTQKIW